MSEDAGRKPSPAWPRQASPEPGDWLPGIRRVPSPNWDERPPGTLVDLLVIHGISLPPGQFGGPWIEDLFLNRLDSSAHPFFRDIAYQPVSAHFLIRRDGEATQYVALSRRAWHAGRSCFQGREACNDFSIGIELEGTDDVPYEPAQYQVLAGMTQAIRERYPAVAAKRIIGHSSISPGRKTDPGPAFDWEHFRRLLAAKTG